MHIYIYIYIQNIANLQKDVYTSAHRKRSSRILFQADAKGKKKEETKAAPKVDAKVDEAWRLRWRYQNSLVSNGKNGFLSLTSIENPWESGKILGTPWENDGLREFYGIYPLVCVNS